MKTEIQKTESQEEVIYTKGDYPLSMRFRWDLIDECIGLAFEIVIPIEYQIERLNLHSSKFVP